MLDGLTTNNTATVDGTIAVYPFSESLSVTAAEDRYEITGITFPKEQRYVAKSFSEEAFPMAALAPSESKNLSFKNIGGIFKLSLTGSCSVSQISLTGNSREPLSGSATVSLGPDGIPSVEMTDDASISVTLICEPAVQHDSEKATDFYISITPTEFETGFAITVTDNDGKTYKVDTDKKNEVIRSSLLEMPQVTLENYGQEETVERWVDLGLSVLWAAYNVGANSPEEYGGYYAWGETEEKDRYSWENYELYNPSTGNFDFIGSEISGTSYDVAHVKWGEGARMPTLEEVKELVNNCTFNYGTYNGVIGDYVTGPNGNSIFLPFAGHRFNDDLKLEGNIGDFWSGTYDDDGNDAYHLDCSEDNAGWFNNYRFIGFSVRPVKEK